MEKKKDKNLFRRLTDLFKSGPVVKRKIRSYDTTVAVADKTKSSGALLFQKSMAPTYATITANAYNLSERLMRYQDFQEMEYSLAIDTKIATPDGFKTIGELVDECTKDPDKTFIVYSYDHDKKRIVPALGKQARQTCVDHAWKITFDNGKTITASPEHRLMLRDGTYRRVEDLKPGDAMMPFYRKDLFANAEEGTKGYSWIYTLDSRFNGWTKEHQLVAEWVSGRRLTEDEVVHHINFTKTDNRPENLRIMSKSDHDSYHASLNNQVKWAAENTQWIEEFKLNHAQWMRDNAPTGRKDVTFARILETAERAGFSMPAISSALDVTWNLIYSRLVANGFSNFEQFVNAYSEGQVDSIVSGKPGLLTRDLTLDMIKAHMTANDTKRSLCIKLGCTVNVLDKFLARRAQLTWSGIRSMWGFSDSSGDTILKENSKNVRNGGRPKGANNHPLTFQQICDSYTLGLTLPRLSEKLSVNKNTVISRLSQHGYGKYRDFQVAYQNCKVTSIEYVGVIPLYDLTVDGYKNFATDSVISHNTPEIAAALDIYSDETCAQDDRGKVLHIYSDNEKIKEVLEDMFYNTLNVEFNIRSWARNLCKYGDFFLYNDIHPEYGVVSAFPIPVNEIEREENYDPNDPMAVRYRWVTLGNRTLENWEVTHFRLLGNDMFLPYGSSIIEPARRIWRQLILIEDAMLVYRVVRAPERRVFYIDVANIPAAEVPLYVEEQRKNLRTNQVIDRNTGRVDLRYNPLSVDEDYFIPVRGTETGTRIETLAGGQNTAAVEDVAYIQKKLFAALKIPRAYLGYDEMLSSKATLAQEDIRFSRTINVIQRVILSELNKLAIIHLYAHGYDNEDLQNFTLHLSNPSTIAQQQKLELWRAKFEIAGSAPEGYVNKNFIRKEIWGLNDEECNNIDRGRLMDKSIDSTIESGGLDDSGGGEDAGGGDTGGGGDLDLFGGGDEGGDEESVPDEENAGEDPLEDEDDPGVSIIKSSFDVEDDEIYSLLGGRSSGGYPIKARSQVKGLRERNQPEQLEKVLANRARKQTLGRGGRRETHMPDFEAMTKGSNSPFTDKEKKDLMNPLRIKKRKGKARDPLDPSSLLPSSAFESFTPRLLSPDIASMLNRWKSANPSVSHSGGLLSESENLEGDELYILDEER